MRTNEIRFEIPENILNSLNQNIDEFTALLRLLTALHLFRSHKLSSGQAADLANQSKEELLSALDQFGINFIDYDPSELEEELQRFRT